MKKKFLITAFATLATLIIFTSCSNKKTQTETKNEFTFVFMTDVHLQEELNAIEGFKQAIDTINKIGPDFVIAGGDQIMDALGSTYEEANKAYNLYADVIKELKPRLYNTMGNHEIFGMYNKDDAVQNHEEYGEKMFENRMGENYQSFTHKGWKFMILNSIEENNNKRYTGLIEDAQMNWIKAELAKTPLDMPIIISTHIPLITAFKQRSHGSTVPLDSSWVVYNSKEVLDLFEDHNLKLVLQGHLHIVEDIKIRDTHFITGGAISASWWEGSYYGFEEGFLKFTLSENDFSYEFVDYGWEAVND